ncbi:MAG: hypothetical protein ACC657_08980 [Thiohalomonadales bacterium]
MISRSIYWILLSLSFQYTFANDGYTIAQEYNYTKTITEPGDPPRTNTLKKLLLFNDLEKSCADADKIISYHQNYPKDPWSWYFLGFLKNKYGTYWSQCPKKFRIDFTADELFSRAIYLDQKFQAAHAARIILSIHTFISYQNLTNTKLNDADSLNDIQTKEYVNYAFQTIDQNMGMEMKAALAVYHYRTGQFKKAITNIKSFVNDFSIPLIDPYKALLSSSYELTQQCAKAKNWSKVSLACELMVDKPIIKYVPVSYSGQDAKFPLWSNILTYKQYEYDTSKMFYLLNAASTRYKNDFDIQLAYAYFLARHKFQDYFSTRIPLYNYIPLSLRYVTASKTSVFGGYTYWLPDKNYLSLEFKKVTTVLKNLKIDRNRLYLLKIYGARTKQELHAASKQILELPNSDLTYFYIFASSLNQDSLCSGTSLSILAPKLKNYRVDYNTSETLKETISLYLNCNKKFINSELIPVLKSNTAVNYLYFKLINDMYVDYPCNPLFLTVLKTHIGKLNSSDVNEQLYRGLRQLQLCQDYSVKKSIASMLINQPVRINYFYHAYNLIGKRNYCELPISKKVKEFFKNIPVTTIKVKMDMLKIVNLLKECSKPAEFQNALNILPPHKTLPKLTLNNDPPPVIIKILNYQEDFRVIPYTIKLQSNEKKRVKKVSVYLYKPEIDMVEHIATYNITQTNPVVTIEGRYRSCISDHKFIVDITTQNNKQWRIQKSIKLLDSNIFYCK